jgi:hypothetical protein
VAMDRQQIFGGRATTRLLAFTRGNDLAGGRRSETTRLLAFTRGNDLAGGRPLDFLH